MSGARTDRRRIAANGRVAALALRGGIIAERYVAGEPRQVIQPAINLLQSPGGPRDRQLLFGELITLFETHDGWSFVQAAKDGYVGYVRPAEIGPPQKPSHWVSAPATHVYCKADFKSAEQFGLSFSSLITATGQSGRFTETTFGFIPTVHLSTVQHHLKDPAKVAENFLGTPYLWGGNSRWGIDCSGLVQAACLACDIPCPGDSDMQEAELGSLLAKAVPVHRNDLLFWQGHVALAVSETTLIHANAADMSVTLEAIESAIARIEKQGDGPVTSRKRLPVSGEAP